MWPGIVFLETSVLMPSITDLSVYVCVCVSDGAARHCPASGMFCGHHEPTAAAEGHLQPAH